MPKKNSSYRIEEEQLRQLDELVRYYQQTTQESTHLEGMKVSKATVVENLIREKYNEIKLNQG